MYRYKLSFKDSEKLNEGFNFKKNLILKSETKLSDSQIYEAASKYLKEYYDVNLADGSYDIHNTNDGLKPVEVIIDYLTDDMAYAVLNNQEIDVHDIFGYDYPESVGYCIDGTKEEVLKAFSEVIEKYFTKDFETGEIGFRNIIKKHVSRGGRITMAEECRFVARRLKAIHNLENLDRERVNPDYGHDEIFGTFAIDFYSAATYYMQLVEKKYKMR